MTKTVEVEVDADVYAHLEGLRRKGESVGEVIRRLVSPKRTLAEITKILAEHGPSEETLDAIEASSERRRRTPRRRTS